MDIKKKRTWNRSAEEFSRNIFKWSFLSLIFSLSDTFHFSILQQFSTISHYNLTDGPREVITVADVHFQSSFSVMYA